VRPYFLLQSATTTAKPSEMPPMNTTTASAINTCQFLFRRHQ